MNFLDTNLPKIANWAIIALFILTVMNFLKSCSSQKEDTRMRKEIIRLNEKVDSLSQKTVSESQLNKNLKFSIENTVFWESLTLEELSDKEHIPINHYRRESVKNDTLK